MKVKPTLFVSLFVQLLLSSFVWAGPIAPKGEFTIQVTESNKSCKQALKGRPYGATIKLSISQGGGRWSHYFFRGTSFPNVLVQKRRSTYKAIKPGTYLLTKATMRTKKKKALFIGSKKPIAAHHIGRNCATKGATTATGVFIHSGSTRVNPGSNACITVSPKEWGRFFKIIWKSRAQQGVLILQRKS